MAGAHHGGGFSLGSPSKVEVQKRKIKRLERVERDGDNSASGTEI